jgi:hypothetical protein
MDQLKAALAEAVRDVTSGEGASRHRITPRELALAIRAGEGWGRIVALGDGPWDDAVRVVRAEAGRAFAMLLEEREREGLKALDNRVRYVLRRYRDLYETAVVGGRLHVRIRGHGGRTPEGPELRPLPELMPPPLVPGQHAPLLPWSRWITRVLVANGGLVSIRDLARALLDHGRYAPGEVLR